MDTGAEGPLAEAILQLATGQYQINPELQAQIDAAQAEMMRNYQEGVAPMLSAAAEGAGRMGSGSAQLAQGRAAGEVARQMAQIGSTMRYQDWRDAQQRQMQALGLGTQRDIAGMQADVTQRGQDVNQVIADAQILMQRYGIDQNTAIQMASQQTARDIASLRSGTQLQVAGMNIEAEQAMHNRSLELQRHGIDVASADRQAALEMQQLLQGQRLGHEAEQSQANRWSQQFMQSRQLELQRYGYDQQTAQRIADRELREQQQLYQQEFDALRWETMSPWQELESFANIVSSLGGPYGTSTTAGTAPGGSYTGPDPWAAAAAGAAGGVGAFGGWEDWYNKAFPGGG